MSENIHRLLIPRRCNAQDELRMITAVAKKIEEVFDLLRIDHRNDHNMRDRPMRVARMYVQ